MPSDPDSSIELLRRVRDGEDGALDRLIERYLPAFSQWARGRLPQWARDGVDTQDLVQETMLHAIRNAPHFERRRDGAFLAYLRRALHNRICDAKRKAQRRLLVSLDSGQPDRGPSPEQQAIVDENRERYEAALWRLPAICREAIIARVELHLTWEDVARSLGMPSRDAARMTVTRALKSLALEMDSIAQENTRK